ncbi:hypothetical protein OQA88_11806 [Cercophora sp. LCS_1]
MKGSGDGLEVFPVAHIGVAYHETQDGEQVVQGEDFLPLTNSRERLRRRRWKVMVSVATLTVLIIISMVVIASVLAIKVPALQMAQEELKNDVAILSKDVGVAGTNRSTASLVSPEAASTHISVKGWEYKGCFHDQLSRLLDGDNKTNMDMANQACFAICGSSQWFSRTSLGRKTFLGLQSKISEVPRIQMDHLPVFQYMAKPYPRVPLVSQQQFDNLAFDGYQDRCGFNLTRLHNRDFTQHSPGKTVSFLQTWLFFGSLHEILSFQHPVDLNQFAERHHLGFGT